MDGRADIEKQLRDQQLVLAKFGEFTLTSDDLDEVLTEACFLVSGALGTDLAKVVELQASGETLLVRAGVGWRPGVVGETRISTAPDTSEGYTLAAQEPVISSNVYEENRFRYPDFMSEHGVKAFVNVPIRGVETVYGILEVDSRTPREFSSHDIAFLQTYANLLAAAVSRLQLIHKLRKTLEDKERMFSEFQHRAKNNIQLMGSFVRLRAKKAASRDARQELVNLANRIRTISLLHEKLYGGSDVDRLDLGAYLSDLAETLLSMHAGGPPMRLRIDVENIVVDASVAVPLGLILNEFMTNSVKYAFDEGGGVIGVKLTTAGDRIAVHIWDNGKGLPENPDTKGGTGISLINALALQIEAEANWTSQNGTALALTFTIT